MTARSRFFDVQTGGEMELSLQRVGDQFKIPHQFGYLDDHYDDPFIVPADAENFRTDLASIPWFFAWLVPGIGTHLPAVLLHDGLVVRRGEAKSHLGPDVDREEADRIFRDAMLSLDTPRVRRWLIWAAVALATAWVALTPRWLWRVLVVVTFGGVVAVGSLATLDLFDVWDVLPWMGDRVWWAEFLGGAVSALAVPLVLSVLWLRRWRAAAIGGVALATLLHVTVAVVFVSGIYWLAEKIVSFPEKMGPSLRKNRARHCETAANPLRTAPGRSPTR